MTGENINQLSWKYKKNHKLSLSDYCNIMLGPNAYNF